MSRRVRIELEAQAADLGVKANLKNSLAIRQSIVSCIMIPLPMLSMLNSHAPFLSSLADVSLFTPK